MFFGIVGENQSLITHALKYIHARNIMFIKSNLITFESDYPERFSHCAVLIKRGEIIAKQELAKNLNSDTVGVADKNRGGILKSQYPTIKRFKIVPLIHTDKDIKDNGQEIIEINAEQCGVVAGYQNIQLYETIDFDKAVSGMGIGMMPSKLALSLINIGIGYREQINQNQDHTYTIRDPFCGFGTTNFLVNSLGYHTIGSDLNITQVKQNVKRWKTTAYHHEHAKQLYFKHDSTTTITHPVISQTSIIVSEGWLGPIVQHKTQESQVIQTSEKVLHVYEQFIQRISDYFTPSKDQEHKKIIILTVPHWNKYNISIIDQLIKKYHQNGRKAFKVEQPYMRKNQSVAREILIAHQ